MEARRLADRRQAGRLLAGRLRHFAGRDDVVVLALPRGGVPVAYEVAVALGAPLEAYVVRKVGVPGHEELALGALAADDTRVVNRPLADALGLTADELEAAFAREGSELERRERAYRGEAPARDLRGRTVILVDDGLATGSTMLAALLAVRRQRPACVVVAVPVADPDVCERLREEADEVVCAMTPQPLHSVGSWYEDFAQTSDDEVRELLAAVVRAHGTGRSQT